MSLGDVLREAVRLADAQRVAGASKAETSAYLEKVVRQTWPFTREWKYLCNKCDDVGLVMEDCPSDATCGRSKIHGPHTFGTPCWCSAGNRFRGKPKPEPEDFGAAGKVKKPSRFGR
jgi:hypothetical protein